MRCECGCPEERGLSLTISEPDRSSSYDVRPCPRDKQRGLSEADNPEDRDVVVFDG